MATRRAARTRRWAVAALALAGCSPSGGGGGRVTVTVVAASSLTEPFSEIGRRFEGAKPGTGVAFAFAASPAVAQQVRAGAPADVVATADRAVVDALARDGLAAPARTFARNRLSIAVARGNPLSVRGVDDLARPDLDLVVCSPEVPCGRLAARALAAAAVRARPRSYEPDVKAVLARVALGEADAGLVYLTDVAAAAGRVEGIALSGGRDLVAEYAVATVAAGGHAGEARAFVDFVVSPAGREVLEAAGFEVP